MNRSVMQLWIEIIKEDLEVTYVIVALSFATRAHRSQRQTDRQTDIPMITGRFCHSSLNYHFITCYHACYTSIVVSASLRPLLSVLQLQLYINLHTWNRRCMQLQCSMCTFFTPHAVHHATNTSTGWPKKLAPFFLYALSLPNINRFS